MAETFTIADSFDLTERHGHAIDLTAPLPLGYRPALERAAHLRNGNPTVYSYRTIAEVMATYHGWHRAEGWWSRELIGAGLVKRSHVGRPQNLVPGGPRLRAVA